MLAARGLLLAIDYPPAGGGVSRLLDQWIVDTDEILWRVITTTPGPATDRVLRTTLGAILRDGLLAGRRWLGGSDRRVVVAGHVYLSAQAVMVAKASGARSAAIAYGREMVPRRYAHRLALAALRAVDIVVPISRHTAGVARDAGVRESQIRIVPPEIGTPWLADKAARRPQGEGLRMVALTRLDDGYKNIEMLLRLCSVLLPIGVVEQLIIVGGGRRLAALRQKAADLGLGPAVKFAGHLPQDDILAVLSAAHVGLFPSRDSMAVGGFEGFGLASHELAAAGLPVLVGAAAGAVEASRGAWASQLDADDLWKWVQAVEQLYADEERRWAMGTAALEWASTLEARDSSTQFVHALLSAPHAADHQVQS